MSTHISYNNVLCVQRSTSSMQRARGTPFLLILLGMQGINFATRTMKLGELMNTQRDTPPVSLYVLGLYRLSFVLFFLHKSRRGQFAAEKTHRAAAARGYILCILCNPLSTEELHYKLYAQTRTYLIVTLIKQFGKSSYKGNSKLCVAPVSVYKGLVTIPTV